MKHYYKQVEMIDNGTMSVTEFIMRMFGSNIPKVYELEAAKRIYTEDGGKKPELFDNVVCEYEGSD